MSVFGWLEDMGEVIVDVSSNVGNSIADSIGKPDPVPAVTTVSAAPSVYQSTQKTPALTASGAPVATSAQYVQGVDNKMLYIAGGLFVALGLFVAIKK